MRALILLLLALITLIPSLPIHAQKILVPQGFNIHLNTESPETYSKIDGPYITLFAECLEVRKDLIVFDIELKNHGVSPLNFDPGEVYYYGSTDPFPDIHEENWEVEFRNASVNNIPNYARSQHFVEGYYKGKIRFRENTKKWLAVVGAGLMIYDAVKDGQDFRREPTRSRVNKSIARDISTIASLTAIDIVSSELTRNQIRTDEDLYYLSEEFLTEKTIRPGESERGKAYFSQNIRNIRYKYYRLMIPVENEWYVFDFRWPTYEEKRAINK